MSMFDKKDTSKLTAFINVVEGKTKVIDHETLEAVVNRIAPCLKEAGIIVDTYLDKDQNPTIQLRL